VVCQEYVKRFVFVVEGIHPQIAVVHSTQGMNYGGLETCYIPHPALNPAQYKATYIHARRKALASTDIYCTISHNI
jgi:hypothetical protein